MTETNDGLDPEQSSGRAGRRHRLVEGTDRDEYWQKFFADLPKTSTRSRHYSADTDDEPDLEERPDEHSATIPEAPPVDGTGFGGSAFSPPPAPSWRSRQVDVPPPVPAPAPPVAAPEPPMPAPAAQVPVPAPVVDRVPAPPAEPAPPPTPTPEPEPESEWHHPEHRQPDPVSDRHPEPEPQWEREPTPGRREFDDWARPDSRAMPQVVIPSAPFPAIDRDTIDDYPAEDTAPPHEPLLSGGHRRPAAEEARKRRRRIVLAAAVAVMLVLVGGVGYAGLKMAGVFESSADYSGISGDSDVLVRIPAGASVRAAGSILKDHGVVASSKAFSNAVGGGTITPGYYKLRTQISAEQAYKLLGQQESQVGVLAVAPGLQLTDTKDSRGQPVPGIFSRIQDATSVTINGKQLGVSATDLANVAANSSAADLGVPQWAVSAVDARKGDPRRIEGLIVAPQQDYSIDPSQNAQEILKGLITDSAAKLQAWGITDYANSGLPSPYAALISASIAEKEVSVQNPTQAQEYRAQVTRVILNRLDKPQRLEMDSTINYTRAVRDLSLSNADSVVNTPWNTYMIEGLPPTPIGAVGQPELGAALNPTPGNWLYFVTVDHDGTTLFTADYNVQLANQRTACHNGLIRCPSP